MIYQGSNNEYLLLEEISSSNCFLLKEIVPSSQTIIWFLDKASIRIDGRMESFEAHQMICLTEFHRVEVLTISVARLIRFNRSFFCILDHDSEVGCKGVLFFGAAKLPVISLNEEEHSKFEALWNYFLIEMGSSDDLQLEMLQMMLKRLLILVTRLYKQQTPVAKLDVGQSELIRGFNFLVEEFFRSKHTVAEYADLLAKSPKTLANVFAKIGPKTPLSYIHDRLMLESRRLLGYSDKPVKEIAYDLGFEDIQSFSRFFKKNEGISPSEFKSNFK